MPPAFRHFQIQVNGGLFFISPEISVFVLVNGFEVTKLIKLDDRVFPGGLVIDVTFIQQHLTAQDVVACKRVTDKLQAAQRKLLAFLDGDHEVDNAFVRFGWIVFEGWRRFSCVFDETLLAVIFLQILEQGLADLLTVCDVAFV